MKIQCDVCEKAQATVICCADEAALCSKCDVEVHAANRLASKHQRLLLQCLSNNNKLPPCDICQEKTAFIFCVEDRALFCKDCDEPIHSANSRAANHHRFLATGIRVALSSSSSCNNKETVQSDSTEKPKPMNLKSPPLKMSAPTKSWTVDELLQFSDYESTNKQKEQMEFGGEFDYFSGFNFYDEEMSGEALSAAEVPQLPASHHYSTAAYGRSSLEFYGAHKKPRLEIPIDDDDDEDYLTVPDLG